ncbi:nucleotidyltransferase family protein [Roseicyclus marinus]|uniref:nucleotidyltransferase family protein n=1 Tax=Roseicyclus marinus TaxID=2161673 RepID=UPI00240FDA62|nr:nucleotidyltransferase family protein [Roseicyclus marinus]MDG3040177.1 nucleotidyltransferase family protein [Roseicyclus marinus]
MEPDATTILLLAAGRSSRMRGTDKLMEEIDGAPILQIMARRATRAGVPVRVVLGPDQETRRAALAGLDLRIVEATDSDGMAASIRAGVEGLTGPVLLVLADMPEITAQDLYLMVSLGAQAPQAILRAASRDGQPGHPVLFPADLVPELAQIRGDQGARDILRAAAARVHLLPLAGDRALVDLDTPEAWAQWRARQGA